MIQFEMLNPRMTPEMLGLIPHFLDNNDPRPAREQLDEGYAHGGGWRPFNGFKMLDGGALKYTGDPVQPPVAKAMLRDETIYYYEFQWVAVVQPDGSFEVCRMD